MKNTFVALLLAFAAVPVWSATLPSELAAKGQWQGRGVQVGAPFTACATISPYMDDTLVHVKYDVFFDVPGRAPVKSEAFFAILDDGVVEGVSFDNQSNSFQITGRHEPNSLQTQWSRHGTAVGISSWRLSEDGETLTFANFGLMPDGTALEIGAVEFSRVAAGTSCTPG